MHEHLPGIPAHTCTPPELPPCCGTGCAVCVLDMVEDYSQQPLESPPALPDASPVCCNTGCVVCVNDYPELVRDGRPDATTLELLQAMEAAERAIR